MKLIIIFFINLIIISLILIGCNNAEKVEVSNKEISLYKIILDDVDKSIKQSERFINSSKRSYMDYIELLDDENLFSEYKLEDRKIRLEKDLSNLKKLKEFHSYLKHHLDSLTLYRPAPKLTIYKPNVNQFTFLQNWDNLKEGNSYKQVLKVLGIPTEIKYPELEIIDLYKLYYFEYFIFENKEVYGSIKFDNKGNIIEIIKPGLYNSNTVWKAEYKSQFIKECIKAKGIVFSDEKEFLKSDYQIKEYCNCIAEKIIETGFNFDGDYKEEFDPETFRKECLDELKNKE